MISQDELGLIKKYGLRYLVTDPAVILPIKDDDALIIHPDVERTATNFERFSIHDAQALREMMRDWDAGLKIAHAHFQAGLAIADNEWSTHYLELRARSSWEVIMSTFEHPVIRRTIMWMGFATIQPPERQGTGALPPPSSPGE
jgi:phytoene dehydrogenase-like protein